MLEPQEAIGNFVPLRMNLDVLEMSYIIIIFHAILTTILIKENLKSIFHSISVSSLIHFFVFRRIY